MVYYVGNSNIFCLLFFCIHCICNFLAGLANCTRSRVNISSDLPCAYSPVSPTAWASNQHVTCLVKAVFALAQLCVAVFNPFLFFVLGARDEAELCLALLYGVAALGWPADASATQVFVCIDHFFNWGERSKFKFISFLGDDATSWKPQMSNVTLLIELTNGLPDRHLVLQLGAASFAVGSFVHSEESPASM